MHSTAALQSKKTAEHWGQAHLFDHWDSLTHDEQRELLADIDKLDFAELQNLLRQTQKEFPTPTGLCPMPLQQLSAFSTEKVEAFEKLGLQKIREGKVAALLLAGGQGSRLGFEGPKGKYSIGLPSGASLFELQALRIKALAERAQGEIPWFVMTSELNREETETFFKAKQFWGLNPQSVFFFNQGQIPAIDFTGKVLLSAPHKIYRVPDGNGGCFSAFYKSGLLDKAQNLGVEEVFIYGVDNALVKPCDPIFTGFHIASGCPTSSKVVSKNSPDEAVGVFYQSDQGPGVIEYSDLDPSLAKATDTKGNLLYNGANIATHFFTLAALRNVAKDPLPYHVARKKIPYVNEKKQVVEVDSPNAFKFEQFLFDVFGRLKDMALLEVSRAEEFAPVKNATGKDSPESARNMLYTLHRQWLLRQYSTSEKDLTEQLAKFNWEIRPELTLDGLHWNSDRHSLESEKALGRLLSSEISEAIQ